MKLFAYAAIGMLMTTASANALGVTQNSDASILAGLLGGSSLSIDSATYTGADISAGSFTDGAASGITIEQGVILSSGDVSDAPGPNSSDATTTQTGTAGAAPVNGLDAAVLEVNFTTLTGDLFFNYVFASEEYNEFTNSLFNDSFQFLLSGPGFPEANIATLPNGDPVEINTVNGGNPLGTDASNPDLFNDNDFGDNPGGTPFDIAYDGFTDALTATATGLTIGEMYTMKFIVQDRGDRRFDSAVFIQGGSFGGVVVDPTDPDPVDPVDPVDPSVVPVPAALPLFLTALAGAGLIGRRRK